MTLEHILKYNFSLLLVFTCLIGGALTASAIPHLPSARQSKSISLEKNLSHILAKEKLPSSAIGIKVVSLDKGDTLFEYNADKPFIPASTVKLITTAAALDILGPTWRFKTEVWGDRRPDEKGLLSGNLYLKGHGDPLLVSEQMWALVNALRRQRISEIKGNIVVDDHYFFVPRPTPSTLASAERAHDALPGALSFNFNSAILFVQPSPRIGTPPRVFLDPPSTYFTVENGATTGKSPKKMTLSVSRKEGEGGDTIVLKGILPKTSGEEVFYRAITAPALYAGHNFKYFLAQHGISVSGKVMQGTIPAAATLLLSHRSQPLTSILSALNHYSNNMIADQILLTLGAYSEGAPGTYEKGIKAVSTFLTQKVGFKEGEWRLTNGSGMDRENSLRPQQIVQLLEYMHRNFAKRSLYVSLLTAPGEEGTLSSRLRPPEFKGSLRGKTGSLTGVNCLSGYLSTESGELLAFSTMANSATHPDKLAKVIDRISSVLSNFSRKE